MAKVADVAAYLCSEYPHKEELSKTRLTKLVYLADWEAVKETGHQLTNIDWVFHKFGPYVDDVIEAVEKDGRFRINKVKNSYGDPKLVIALSNPHRIDSGLNHKAREIVDSVVGRTKSMYWNNFIRYVYSTPPIERSNRYSRLDLEKIWEEINSEAFQSRGGQRVNPNLQA